MMRAPMHRRSFLTLLGGASAAAWPLAVRGQQGERGKRVSLLNARAENDLPLQAGTAALLEMLAKLGWIEGRNLRIDVRFAADDLNRLHAYAAELVSLAPDVIVSTSAVATRALQQRTQTIPIVVVG